MTCARTFVTWLVGASMAVTPVMAQTPVSTSTPSAAAPRTYDDGGRRDPFVSLIVPKTPVASGAARPRPTLAGLAGVAIADVQVKGLIKSGATLIALLQAADGRTYMAKRSDRLSDGVVSRIDSDGVVFTERIADAAGVVRPRDVRKPLRTAVSGGQ